jgi:hypothetical protein
MRKERGRDGRARPGDGVLCRVQRRAHARSGTTWAFWARPVWANVVLFFGQRWYRHDQGSMASLFGKVERTRDEWRGRGHGDRHGTWHGVFVIMPLL